MGENMVHFVRVTLPSPPPPSSSPPPQQIMVPSPPPSSFSPRRIDDDWTSSQNKTNFEQSAVPLRFMYYHNNSWVNFSAEAVEALRNGFLDRTPIIEVLIDGAECIFDLLRMVQIDYNGYQRSISWIHENGKWVYPEDFRLEGEFTESNNNNNINRENMVRITLPSPPPSSFSPQQIMVPSPPPSSFSPQYMHSGWDSVTNFDRSTVPLRFMYYRNDSWVNFSAEVVEALRTGFLDGREIVEVLIDGVECIFDLPRMLQIDYTGYHRSISWIHEDGKWVYPEGFLSS